MEGGSGVAGMGEQAMADDCYFIGGKPLGSGAICFDIAGWQCLADPGCRGAIPRAEPAHIPGIALVTRRGVFWANARDCDGA